MWFRDGLWICFLPLMLNLVQVQVGLIRPDFSPSHSNPLAQALLLFLPAGFRRCCSIRGCIKTPQCANIQSNLFKVGVSTNRQHRFSTRLKKRGLSSGLRKLFIKKSRSHCKLPVYDVAEEAALALLWLAGPLGGRGRVAGCLAAGLVWQNCVTLANWLVADHRTQKCCTTLLGLGSSWV